MPKKVAQSIEEALLEKMAKLERENEKLRLNADMENDEFIRLDSYVEVMSLFSGKLTLSTESLGKGRKFSFTRFGETKRILYNDLASIMENFRSFMENGIFYILNERVVRKHGLDDIYSKILNKETMLKVISCDSIGAVKLYENAPQSQRETIDGMIIAELKAGNPNMDMNVVTKISALSGRDLVKSAAEAKLLESIPVPA